MDLGSILGEDLVSERSLGHDRSDRPQCAAGHGVSRRAFLRSAGLTVSAAVLGGGFSEVLASCQNGEEPSTDSAALVTTESISTTEVPTPTSVAAEPVFGREIKLGLVSPITGSLALYGKADEWWMDLARKTLPEGILGADGKRHMIRIVRADSGSDAAAASRAATLLITGAQVDLMMVSGPAVTVEPVTGRCEALSCPLIANLTFLPDFVNGRALALSRSSRWTYAQAFGFESLVANYLAMWDQVDTNKKLGLLIVDDVDGSVWLSEQTILLDALDEAGYSPLVLTYPVSAVDYGELVSALGREGCEICLHTGAYRDFTLFWEQAVAQAYRPKVLTTWRALSFPQELEALRSIVGGVTVGATWHPTWPFRDSLSGLSCQELAEDYTAKTGEQWTPAIGQYAKFEWAVDVFERVVDPDDKAEIALKIAQTDVRTCAGPVDFTTPQGADDGRHVSGGIYLAPLGGAQWLEGERFPYEQVIVSDALSEELLVEGSVQSMLYDVDQDALPG